MYIFIGIYFRFLSSFVRQDEPVNALESFNLSHLFAAWIVIGTGLLLALMAMSLELFGCMSKKPKRDQYHSSGVYKLSPN